MLGGPGMSTLSEDVMSKNHKESVKCDSKANVIQCQVEGKSEKRPYFEGHGRSSRNRSKTIA